MCKFETSVGGRADLLDKSTRHAGALRKLTNAVEAANYKALQNYEELLRWLAIFHGAEQTEDPELEQRSRTSGAELSVELEDLTAAYSSPCVMDIKMGTRTFLESENSKKRRLDLLKKMLEVDSSAATEEETREGITKLRYQQFRDSKSSSATLGFRAEAWRTGTVKCSKDNLKGCCDLASVTEQLRQFTSVNAGVRPRFIEELKALRQTLETSEWFQHHELISSSLLLTYEADPSVSDPKPPTVHMIDFAKTSCHPDQILNHRLGWELGNHEDGYLTGLDTLISALETILD